VALLGNPKTAVYYDYLLGAAQAVAPSLGIEAVPSHIENDAADIERAIAAIASIPNSGMIVLPEATTTINRDLIIRLVARNRLPAIYNFKLIVKADWAPSRRCRQGCEREVVCYHFSDRDNAGVCAGSKAERCDQGGRAKSRQNYQRR
jgi:hypothetical protein